MEILGILLKILGALVLVLLLALAGGYFWLRWKIRSTLKQIYGVDNLGKAQELAKYGNETIAARITLEDFDGEPAHPDELRRASEQAEQLGFESVGRYSVDSMPGLCMQMMVRHNGTVVLVLYDHPMTEVFFDVATIYSDNTAATVSTSKGSEHHQIDIPGCQKWRCPDLSLSEALEKLLAERKDGQIATVDRNSVVPCFERAYALEMDHRIRLNFISDQAIIESGKIFGIDNMTPTQEQIDSVRNMQLEQLQAQIDTACIDNFVHESKMTAAQWEACRDRVVLIHERQSGEEVLDAFLYSQSTFEDDDPQFEKLRAVHSHDPFLLFATLDDLLPLRKRYLELGEVHMPVRAKVYLPAR